MNGFLSKQRKFSKTYLELEIVWFTANAMWSLPQLDPISIQSFSQLSQYLFVINFSHSSQIPRRTDFVNKEKSLNAARRRLKNPLQF